MKGLKTRPSISSVTTPSRGVVISLSENDGGVPLSLRDGYIAFGDLSLNNGTIC